LLAEKTSPLLLTVLVSKCPRVPLVAVPSELALLLKARSGVASAFLVVIRNVTSAVLTRVLVRFLVVLVLSGDADFI
jgi:hypothetical protein